MSVNPFTGGGLSVRIGPQLTFLSGVKDIFAFAAERRHQEAWGRIYRCQEKKGVKKITKSRYRKWKKKNQNEFHTSSGKMVDGQDILTWEKIKKLSKIPALISMWLFSPPYPTNKKKIKRSDRKEKAKIMKGGV